MRTDKLRLALLSGLIVAASLAGVACTSHAVSVTPSQQDQKTSPDARARILQAATADGRLGRLKAAVAQAGQHAKKTAQISSPAEGVRLDHDLAQLLYSLWGITKQANGQEIQVLFAVAAAPNSSGPSGRTTKDLIDTGPSFFCTQTYGWSNDEATWVPTSTNCGFFGPDGYIYIPNPYSGGGGAGGGGAPEGPMSCTIAGNSASASSTVSGDTILQSLFAQLQQNYGVDIKVNDYQNDPNHPTTDARADLANKEIALFPNALAKSGNDEAQVLFEEGMHLWMEKTDLDLGRRPIDWPIDSAHPVTAVVTLSDGVILTFVMTNTNGVLNNAELGYEHR